MDVKSGSIVKDSLKIIRINAIDFCQCFNSRIIDIQELNIKEIKLVQNNMKMGNLFGVLHNFEG
jgi:hypothetical protein